MRASDRGGRAALWYCYDRMATRKREVTPVAPVRPDFLILGLAAAGFAIAAYPTGLKWMLGAAFIYAMPAGGGTGFEGALARHLRETGAVMYGAHWCPHCTEQKALFGDAAKDVPYVECAADTVNGRPDLCEKAGVKVFPTWVIGTERREGVQSLSALSTLSKFEPAAAKPTK